MTQWLMYGTASVAYVPTAPSPIAPVRRRIAGLVPVSRTVDRKQRAADLRALRVQGLPRRMARCAALWGYLSIVLLAALTGSAGAAVAWVAAGDRMPIFTDAGSSLTPPHWPTWQAVAQPWRRRPRRSHWPQ